MTFKTVDDLTMVFMEMHRIQRGHGGTPLPAPLGTFAFCSQIIEKLKLEHFTIKRNSEHTLVVSDDLGISVRKFSSRAEPQVWVWPSPTVDYRFRGIVCPVTILTGEGETFPVSTNERICRAIAATHPECHQIIQGGRAIETD